MAILRGGRRIGNYDIRIGLPRDKSLVDVAGDPRLKRKPGSAGTIYRFLSQVNQGEGFARNNRFIVRINLPKPIGSLTNTNNKGINDLESNQIVENIETAEKQREDSAAKLKEYDEVILKSKSEAKTMFNQTREKALKDIIAKKEVLDQQIDDEINKAEKEIEVLRVSAPDKINKIAIETSSELLEKLIGSDVNSSSISAIVDDLSKRNRDKYYGN